MTIEHRIYIRRRIDTSIKVLEDKDRYRNMVGSDISRGGLCVITAKPDIEAGQTFIVQFDLPIGGRLMKVEGEVEVIHKTNLGSDTFKVGLAFTHLDSLSARNVESYINNSCKPLPAASGPSIRCPTSDSFLKQMG